MRAQILFAIMIIVISEVSPAFAHKTVYVEQYEIEVGWRDEPPLVSQQNVIVFAITTEEGDGVSSGVTNAFKDLTATIKSGTAQKQLDEYATRPDGSAKPGRDWITGKVTRENLPALKHKAGKDPVKLREIDNIEKLLKQAEGGN